MAMGLTGTMDNDKEPVAGLSAASSCIRLSICLGKQQQPAPSFHPVYTHQAFADEFISGWRPQPNAEQASKQIYQDWKCKDYGDDIHSSYKNISDAQKELDVNVLLSPSCDKCKIEVHTSSQQQIIATDEPPSKKIKKVTFEVADNNDDAQATVQNQSVDEVIKRMQSSIPPIVSVTVDGISTSSTEGDNDIQFNYLSQPIGSVLKSYSRKIKYNDGTIEEGNFVITLANASADPSVASYHNAVQPLARWFIETADDVNVADTDGGGFWSVLYLLRKHDNLVDGTTTTTTPPTHYFSLAGYVTLFHFNAPFKKPEPGIIVRICQALILPLYQRSGHGSELLLSLHDYAERYIKEFAIPPTGGMDIVEVNVEDPAPGFIALRDYIDYQRFISLISTGNSKFDNKYLEMNQVNSREYFQQAPIESTLTLSSLLKITKRQVEIIHEIYKLAAVEKWKQDSKDTQQINQVETYYRLMIKKSLKSYRTEELGACEGGKEEQKALLAKWFEETYSHYRKLLGIER